MDEEKIRRRLCKFYDRVKTKHSLDINDFKISKNFASGNGLNIWNIGDRKIVDRAQVPVNLLEPIVNSVVFKYTENPFEFKIRSDGEEIELDEFLDKKELKFQISSCLREVCVDGISYLLVYKKDDRIKLRRLNNFNVVMGDCEYADGQDCKECVIIEKKKIKNKDLYAPKTDMETTFESVLNLAKDEVPLITYYFKEKEEIENGLQGGIRQVKFLNSELVENVLLPLGSIPIVRFYGKECPIDNFDKNWRGFYYLVRGLLKNIDMTMSLWQERLFTSETFKYWIAKESLGTDTQTKYKINGFPKVFETYRAFDPVTKQPLPIPQKVDARAFLEDLALSYETNKSTIYEILGTVAGEEKGNETAEAVLLRREAKDTAVNETIKNLLDACWQLAEILEQFIGFKIEITSDLFDKAKKQQDLQKIMALVEYTSANPLARGIFPVMLAKLDIDDNSKNVILESMAKAFDMETQNNQNIQMLQAALQEAQNKIEQLQMNTEVMMTTTALQHEAKMTELTLEAQTKGAEIELEYAKLGQKEGDSLRKLEVDVAKVQSDAVLKAADIKVKSIDKSSRN